MFEKIPIGQVVADAIRNFDDHHFDNHMFLFCNLPDSRDLAHTRQRSRMSALGVHRLCTAHTRCGHSTVSSASVQEQLINLR
jgi:hypothetical protein